MLSLLARLAVLLTIMFTANASPALPSPLETAHATNLSNISNLGDPYECYERHFFSSRRSYLVECAQAVAKMPNYHKDGTFHRGGDPNQDPFALPRAESAHSCEVLVDVKYGHPEDSNWQAITIAAYKIMVACSTGYGRTATTGGETTAGLEQRIVVTVGKPQPVVGGVGGAVNTTDVAIAKR